MSCPRLTWEVLIRHIASHISDLRPAECRRTDGVLDCETELLDGGFRMSSPQHLKEAVGLLLCSPRGSATCCAAEKPEQIDKPPWSPGTDRLPGGLGSPGDYGGWQTAPCSRSITRSCCRR